MLFNSIDFAVFLPIVFALYWFVCNKSIKLQNTLVLIASYVFYGWWDWRFLSLIFISSDVDYCCGRAIDRARNPLARGTLALIDGILGATLLYGRKPLLAFVWLFAFWAAGVFVFDAAERAGAFKPGLPFILRSPEWLACGLPTGASLRVPSLDRDLPGQAEPGETQLACYRRQPEGVSFPRFQALMYSLDVLLPVLQLNQTTYWRPNPAVPFGGASLNYYYVQTIVGWVLSLLAIAGFSGLVKSR